MPEFSGVPAYIPKVVLVGDTQQLQAIDAGAPMRAVGEAVGTVSLEDIRRQGIGWQREASLHFARGEVSRALNAYAKHKCVSTAEIPQGAVAAMVRDWATDRQALPGESQIMMAFRREQVAQANQAAREILQKGGELGPSETVQTTQGAREFAVGDRLYFLKNDRGLGVKNGSLGTVEALKDGQMVVRLDGAEQRRVAVDTRAYDAIDHGYAATVHKAQGLTVKRAYVLGSELYDRNVINVAMTRHTEGAKLYVSKQVFPTSADAIRAFSKARPKDLAVDYDKVAREADRLKREATGRQEAARQEREQRRAAERPPASAAPRSREQERAEAIERLVGPPDPTTKARQEAAGAEMARRLAGLSRPLEQKLERDPATERAARQERVKAFYDLKGRYEQAKGWAKEPLLTERQIWEGRQDVRSAAGTISWCQTELKRLTKAAEAFREAHPIKAAFGVKPDVWSGGVQRPLRQTVERVQEDLGKAEARLKALGKEPQVLAEVRDQVAEHNGKVRRGKEQLPVLTKAYEQASPQQGADIAEMTKEREQQRQLDRSRGHGLGR